MVDDASVAEKCALNALSPLDGRYSAKVEDVAPYFSEFSYMRHRVEVEVEYFLTLLKVDPPLKNLGHVSLSGAQIHKIRAIYANFSMEDGLWIKQTEVAGGAKGGPQMATNHDVKSVEYFVKHKLSEIADTALESEEESDKELGELKNILEFVHFGLTSQDINNTALPLMTKRFIYEVYLPKLLRLVIEMDKLARSWSNVPMLARTHGQPASPTTVGKEFMVFVSRLRLQIVALDAITHSAKFGGATGNLNSHFVAYPECDWVSIMRDFIQGLGLEREEFTTQIDNYDNAAALFHNISRINTILLDFCRDIWTYISNELFKQKTKKGEIGSSAMPHKVNPIDFENAEGNLGMANAIFTYLARKLPISRMQRDLTDSTATRNIGVPFGYSIVALASVSKGIGKLVLNTQALDKELDCHWEVVAEALQTILRREGINGAYELLKEETRGETVTEKSISLFLGKIEKSAEFRLSPEVMKELRSVSPRNYVGRFEPGEPLQEWLRVRMNSSMDEYNSLFNVNL